ncbi:sigma-70 family RNA polymerase sigma factor [Tautonia rosea]|uniref:sigma-70 family RNA polymerase sigma factor n=1 Tax=Tautonia rosea TaxID=2728037 RepID=UPI00147343DC|nr:sigma-70 family RNA polymerase sigma factor [Tautonia rosea]
MTSSRSNDRSRRIDSNYAAARVGDPEALAGLLESMRAELVRIARRGLPPLLRAKVGASDIVQQAMVDTVRQLDQFRGRTRGQWRAWILVILRNRLAMVRRSYLDVEKRRVDREVPLGEPDPAGGDLPPELVHPSSSPASKAMRAELEAILLEVLDRLPVSDRDLVRWHHEERQTFEQIADRLGISAEAARKRWGRAMIRLREALEGRP